MACSNCDNLGLREVNGKMEECPCGSNAGWLRQFAELRTGEALELLHGKFSVTPLREIV